MMMNSSPLEISHWSLSPSQRTGITLLVDAGDPNDWQGVSQAVEELCTGLGAGMLHEIIFLGNPSGQGLRPHEFLKKKDAWMKEYGGRVSLVAPIIRHRLQNGRIERRMVIVGNGPVFDLADWLDRADWLLIRTGEQEMGKGLQIEEIKDLSIAIHRLNNPVREIKVDLKNICGKPLNWDNKNYKWKEGVLTVTKITGDEMPSLDLNLTLISPSKEPPIATLTFREGEQEFNLVNSQTTADIEEPKWENLSTIERFNFSWAIEGTDFRCEICKNEHQAKQILCAKDEDAESKGVQIFRTAYTPINKRGHKKGFLLFRRRKEGNSNQVDVSYLDRQSLSLPNNEVALLEDGEVHVYRYSSREKAWHKGVAWDGYLKLSENTWAACL